MRVTLRRRLQGLCMWLQRGWRRKKKGARDAVFGKGWVRASSQASRQALAPPSALLILRHRHTTLLSLSIPARRAPRSMYLSVCSYARGAGGGGPVPAPCFRLLCVLTRGAARYPASFCFPVAVRALRFISSCITNFVSRGICIVMEKETSPFRPRSLWP
jgi:hypothetical protein